MTYVPQGRIILNLSDNRTVVLLVCKQAATQFAPTVYENMYRFVEDVWFPLHVACYGSG